MMSSFYRTELVDLTLSLLEENKHLKADKEALIAGQETLQKYLAIIEANGISVEKYKDSINCLEKACDELKEALKKKDAELKAVRHYYNECLQDLKKAHAEIERLSGEQIEERTRRKNAVNAYHEARAEAFKDCAKVFVGIARRVHEDTDDEVLIVKRSTLDCFMKGLTGDAE